MYIRAVSFVVSIIYTSFINRQWSSNHTWLLVRRVIEISVLVRSFKSCSPCILNPHSPQWYAPPLTLPWFPAGIKDGPNPVFLTWHYLTVGLEGGGETWVTKLEIGAHQTVEQIPILLLGTKQKSWYPSPLGVMPTGESAQVAASGGGRAAGNMCM